MHYFICPSGNHKITIITVGDNTFSPTHSDLEFIRSKIDEDKTRINNINDWFKGTTKVTVIPESPSDKQYVYRLGCQYQYEDNDIKTFQDIFEESVEDPGFIIFTHHLVQIERINKVLLPFL